MPLVSLNSPVRGFPGKVLQFTGSWTFTLVRSGEFVCTGSSFLCVCGAQRTMTHHSKSGEIKETDRQMKGHSLKLVECKAEQKHDKEMVSIPEHFKVRSPVRQRGKRKEENSNRFK